MSDRRALTLLALFFAWTRERACRRAALLVWLWTALLAVMSAVPASTQLQQLVGQLPRGEALLFEPGATILLEVLTQHSSAVFGGLRSGIVILVLAWPLTVLASGTLYCALSAQACAVDTTLLSALTQAVKLWHRFLLIGFAARIAQGVFLGATLLLAGAVLSTFEQAIDERTHDLAMLAALALALLGSGLLEIFASLTKAGLVVSGKLLPAIRRAIDAAAFRTGRLGGAWFAIQSVALLAIAACSMLVASLPLEIASTWPALVAALLHQLTYLFVCFVSVCAAALTVQWLAATEYSAG